MTPTVADKLHVHVLYASKKSCQYRLPFHRFQFRFPRRSVHRFTVPFTILPFRSPFYRSVLPFYRFTVPSIGYRESGDSGRVSRGPKAWEV